MKGRKMAHPSQCREIGPGDVERLLSQGWRELKAPVSRNAAKQRVYKERRKQHGYKTLAIMLPVEVLDAFNLRKLEKGETAAQLLIRLLGYEDEFTMDHGHK